MTEYAPSEVERLWDVLNTHRPRLTDTEMHEGGHVDRIVLGRIGDVSDAIAPIIREAQADAAEATLARLRALLDQIEHTQYHTNVSIDRVRRALGDVTP